MRVISKPFQNSVGLRPGAPILERSNWDRGIEFNEFEFSRTKFSGLEFSEIKFSRLESSQGMKWHQFRPLRDLFGSLRDLFGTPSGQSVRNSSQVENPEMP